MGYSSGTEEVFRGAQWLKESQNVHSNWLIPELGDCGPHSYAQALPGLLTS